MDILPKILGIIPARKGSKSVPNKHINFLGNYPLIHYTFVSALASKLLNKVILTTDCDEIISIGHHYKNLQIPFKRPDKLAQDHTPTLPVILHTLDYFESIGEQFDAVCLLQPTSPFRCVGLIDQAIEKFINSHSSSLVSIQKTPSQYNPHWAFMLDQEKKISPVIQTDLLIPNRQSLPDTYYRDGQIYLASVTLIKSGKLVDEHTIGYLNTNSMSINIDTPSDWALAEEYIQYEQGN